MDKIIVYDSEHPGARNNICFAKEYADKGPGHQFTVELATQAKLLGIESITSDVYLRNRNQYQQKALLISDMVSPFTDSAIQAGAAPFLCFSFESPLIARYFYSNIKKLAGRYAYNIQFGGTQERLSSTPTVFETMHFPVSVRTPLPGNNWATRKHLILINSNKRIFRTDYSNLKESLRSLISQARLEVWKISDPWMRSKEIYRDRIEMIKYFATRPDFELYGLGWENPIRGYSQEYNNAVKKVFKGGIGYSEKISRMNQFKFNVCFENCSFPGYVTEKIFDSLLSGSIPIYFGAPDIDRFVPKQAFIDFRNFKNLNELAGYLDSLSEDEANGILRAGSEFLAGEHFDKHFLPNFISNVIEKIIKH